MKTSLKIAVLTGLMMQSAVSGAFAEDEAKPGLLKRLFGTLSWEETISTTDSPREAAYAVLRHISYRKDNKDELTKPEESWKRGYGDCEDIAHAIVALCHEKGFDAWVEVFYSPLSFNAHAVAVGRVDGKLWIANDRFRTVEDMDEARAVIANSMNWKKETVSSQAWHKLNIRFNVAGRPAPNKSAQNPVELASVNP